MNHCYFCGIDLSPGMILCSNASACEERAAQEDEEAEDLAEYRAEESIARRERREP